MSKISMSKKEGHYKVKTIFIDEEPWRDIHEAIFGPFDFSIQSVEEFLRLEQKRVKFFLYRKLSLKSYLSQELKKQLKEYLVTPSLIESSLKELKDLGYLNDVLGIESFIRSSKLKKLGTGQILQKLVLKGVDKEAAKEALKIHDSEEDRIFRIKKILELKYKNRNLKEYTEKQKVIAALFRKGYSLEDIYTALGSNDDEYRDNLYE